MANPITAAEWEQVVANLRAQIIVLENQQIQLQQTIAQNSSQQIALRRTLSATTDITQRNEINNQLIVLNDQRTQLENQRTQLTEQIITINQQIENARLQASLAATGAPDTSVNPVPANNNPGENTEVLQLAPTIIPLIQPNQLDIGDPLAQQRFVAEQTLIQVENESPTDIDAQQDPFEQQRLEAEQRFDQVENEFPVEIDEQDPFEQQRIEAEQALNRQELFDEEAGGPLGQSRLGLSGPLQNTRAQATAQDVANYSQNVDWRVKLRLAPDANYLYKADDPGILLPLKQSDGVIFPYTPSITVNYTANYDGQDLTHSNYKIFQYRNSSIDQIAITCDFTAQDTFEANYLLAVIHFFRSVTKMFYGQDQNPALGAPPPLCYISGLGAFQFDNHPIAITNFNYVLPNDVDYIRAGSATVNAGVNLNAYQQRDNTPNVSQNRLGTVQPGAVPAPPNFQLLTTREPTYVPTKIQITLAAVPIVSRNDVSNRFSLKDYASGKLLRGSQYSSGGIW